MRRAILSDIHGNLEALQAVLADAREQQVEEIYCLGDITSYGSNPVKCLDIALTFDVTLLGSDDERVATAVYDGPKPLQRTLRWARQQIATPVDGRGHARLTWLANLPIQRREGDYLYVHGSPRQPVGEYVFPEDIYNSVKLTALFAHVQRYCFQGHTHFPGIFLEPNTFISIDECRYRFSLPPGKMMCNVGSVGQPRDGDPRACYAILTDDEVQFRRIDYPFEVTTADWGPHGDRLGSGR